jgi:hypothetical protein
MFVSIDTMSEIDSTDLFTPLLEPLDIGFGSLPAYNYLIAVGMCAHYSAAAEHADVFGWCCVDRNTNLCRSFVVVVILLVSIWYHRSTAAAAAELARRAEAERSKRVLERPIVPGRTFTNEQLKAYDGMMHTDRGLLWSAAG